MPDIIKAPFSQVQVFFLNKFQETRRFHPFTCGGDGCRANLVATTDGWRCPNCDYTQDWAHDFMAKPLPQSQLELMREQAKHNRSAEFNDRITALEARLTALEKGKVINTTEGT
jgi:hypothetical protein